MFKQAAAAGMVAALLGIAGCDAFTKEPASPAGPTLTVDQQNPASRVFSGKLLRIDPVRAEIRVVLDDQVPPGQVPAKYDRTTKFYLDGRETTLDDVMSAFFAYMPAQIKGTVGEKFFNIEVIKISSMRPAGIPAETRPADAPATRGR